MIIGKVKKDLCIVAALAALSLASGCTTMWWNEEVDRPHQYRFDDQFLGGPPGTPFDAVIFQEGRTSWYSLYSTMSNEEYYLEDPGDGGPLSLVPQRAPESKRVGMALLHPVPLKVLAEIPSFGELCDDDIFVHSRNFSKEWKKEYGCLPPPCYLADLYIAYGEDNAPVAIQSRGSAGLGPPRPFLNRLAGPWDHVISASIKSGYFLSWALDVATFPVSLPAYVWVRGMAKGFAH